MRTKKLPTPKGYERRVAADYRRHKWTVVRVDHTNYMPDFMIYYETEKHTLAFVEVKRYLSCTSVEQVLKRIQRNQRKQWGRLFMLSFHADVLLRIMLKGGVEETVRLYNGKVVSKTSHSVAQSGAYRVPAKRKKALGQMGQPV